MDRLFQIQKSLLEPYVFIMTLDKFDKTILAIDIGSSSVKHALIEKGKSWSNIKVDKTPLPARSFGAVCEIVLDLVKRHPDAELVGISTPGTVQNGVVLSAGNFTSYENIDWAATISTHSKAVVSVLNDGRASALAEWHGPNVEGVLLHMVLGTGVGSGIVIDGKLFGGSKGNAGHIGHITVTESQSVKCSCGKQGCAELFAGVRNMTTAWQKNHPEQGFEELVQAVKQEDPKAQEIIQRAGFYLGRAVAAAMNVLNPSVITIGGGTMLALERTNGNRNLLFDAFLESVQSSAQRRVLDCDIRHAHFENDGGVLGAALFAVGV